MAEYIDGLIKRNEVAALENEREGIRERRGPTEKWEWRVVEYLNQQVGEHD